MLRVFSFKTYLATTITTVILFAYNIQPSIQIIVKDRKLTIIISINLGLLFPIRVMI
jgi:hypothetical protein